MQGTQAHPLRAQARPLAPIASTAQRLRKGISPKHIGLFALMLASEAPVIFLRGLILELGALALSTIAHLSIQHGDGRLAAAIARLTLTPPSLPQLWVGS